MTETQLHDAIQAFHTAVQRRDGLEARVRNGEHGQDLFDRSLLAAEAVVQARVALYLLLMQDGWTPPPTLADAIELDAAILHEPSPYY